MDAKEELQDAAADAVPEKPEEKEPRWYVIHTATNYENKVMVNLDRKRKSLALEHKILKIEVPEEEKTIVHRVRRRKGQSKDSVPLTATENKEKKVKLFPGYVLVQMILDENTWYVVRNTPGVTRFVSPDGTKPSPLSQEEYEAIKRATQAEPELLYDIQVSVGESAKIIAAGPYEGFTGTVKAVDNKTGRVWLMTQIIDGRDVQIEVAANEVEPL